MFVVFWYLVGFGFGVFVVGLRCGCSLGGVWFVLGLVCCRRLLCGFDGCV